MSASGADAAFSAPRPASASASRSAPSFAAQPPQSVSSVRRKGGRFERGHRPMIGRRPSRRRRPTIPRYHRDGSGRVPVGPLVFNTSGAALGAARWVRLPRVPATEGSCRRIARVPRASSALLAACAAALADGDGPGGAHGGRARGARRRADAPGGRRARPDARRSLPRRSLGRLEAFATGARGDLTPVINATGVILHTNLGRAPWPAAAIEAATRAAAGYSLLEIRSRGRPPGAAVPRRRGAPHRADRRRGRAGHRQQRRGPCPRGRASPVGAGSPSRAASWSRSVAASGSRRSSGGPARAWSRSARRTGRGAADFEPPLADGRATVVLRVHPSNFSQAGFVEAPDPTELARLAHAHGAIVVDDLGSGALARDGGLRAGPRADAGRAAGRRRGHRHVQRRQAGRWSAGRARRRAGGPHRPDPEGPAGARDPAGQGDACRARRDARAVPGGPGGQPRSPSGG